MNDWPESELQRYLERQRIREALEPDDRVRRARLAARGHWSDWIIVAIILSVILAGVFWK